MLPETDIVRGIHADFLCFKTNDFISNHIREKGIWGEAELNLALLFSDGMEKPLILDIGANLGAFSIPVAKILSSADATVYAFEAQRIVFQQLCANAILNRLGNVVACHAAVGSSAGIARIPKVDCENTLNIGAVSLLPEIQKVSQVAYSDTEHEEIRMISIDSLGLEGRCTCVKIDVEGFESEVISGMLGFLEKILSLRFFLKSREKENSAALPAPKSKCGKPAREICFQNLGTIFGCWERMSLRSIRTRPHE